jgi:hypothetical protein
MRNGHLTTPQPLSVINVERSNSNSSDAVKPAVASPASMLVENRRQFRRIERGSPTLPSMARSYSSKLVCETAAMGAGAGAGGWAEGAGSRAGMFDALDDECVLLILAHLINLPRHIAPNASLDVKHAVEQVSATMRSFVFSCKRILNIFNTMGSKMRLELIARSATQIVPRRLHEDPFAFSSQFHEETASSEQLQALKHSIEGLATHCAGKCCARARKEVNREFKRKAKARATRATAIERVMPVLEQTHVKTATASGEVMFAAVREHVGPKQRRDYLKRMQLCATPATPARVVETHRVPVDTSDAGRPVSVRCDQEGKRAVVVRPVHEGVAANTLSMAQLWCAADDDAPRESTGESARPELTTTTAMAPPTEFAELQCVNVQDAWFTDDSPSVVHKNALIVLYSTAFVHPMGVLCGTSSAVPGYGFATYNTETGALEEVCGPFPGFVQSASPTRRGDEVSILAFDVSDVGGFELSNLHIIADVASPTTLVHNVSCAEPVVISSPTVKAAATTKLCTNSISPCGGCVLAIHRGRGSVFVELLVRSQTGDKVSYVSVQLLEIGHWASPPSSPPHFGHETLRAPYSVEWSPCGRFAAIIDQRVTFGMDVGDSYGMIVIDQALRLERRGVRAMPLASVEDAAPRSLSWCRSGMWCESRYGCIFIKA